MERPLQRDRPDPLRRGLLISALGLIAGRTILAQETIRDDDPAPPPANSETQTFPVREHR